MKKPHTILSLLFSITLMSGSLIACNNKTAVTKQDMYNYQAQLSFQREEIKKLNTNMENQQQEIINQLEVKIKNQQREMINQLEVKIKNQQQEMINQLETKIKNQQQEMINQLETKIENQQQELIKMNVTFMNLIKEFKRKKALLE